MAKIMESPLRQIRSGKQPMELVRQHCSVKGLTVASSKHEVAGIPSWTAPLALVLLPVFVITEFAYGNGG